MSCDYMTCDLPLLDNRKVEEGFGDAGPGCSLKQKSTHARGKVR